MNVTRVKGPLCSYICRDHREVCSVQSYHNTAFYLISPPTDKLLQTNLLRRNAFPNLPTQRPIPLRHSRNITKPSDQKITDHPSKHHTTSCVQMRIVRWVQVVLPSCLRTDSIAVIHRSNVEINVSGVCFSSSGDGEVALDGEVLDDGWWSGGVGVFAAGQRRDEDLRCNC